MERDQIDISAAETVPEPQTGGVYVAPSGDVVIGAPAAVAFAVPADNDESEEVA